MRVYIINGRDKINKLDDRSHRGCFMGYAATTGIILYWKPDQPFIIYRSHNVWFDEYNSRLSIEDNYTPGSLLLRQDPEGRIHYSDLLNLIPCKLDLLHLVIQQLSHIKLNFLPMERTLVLIYCMMKILQYLISLIQSQIIQLVINLHHKLIDMCVS